MKKIHVAILFKTLALIVLVGTPVLTFAKKGMWMPPLLASQEKDMRSRGLEIPIQNLYNEDGTSLNNAVVLFGRGCTGEVISSKGLILTNHHCGYGTVQGLSSKEKDYFAKGFWAMNHEQELPCPGLTVTFIRKMENVTDKIIVGLPDTLNNHDRDSIINIRINNLEKGYRYTTKYDAAIKPYFYGNQYWVILSETYTDIRLVGFPPNGIGVFGGDTDNWMWPRHTGDFSMFRIYADKDNKPAKYSKENQPYQTNNFLRINTSGYKEGDFTMVYGFPGYTQEYISSYQLGHIYNIIDPVRIEARTILLDTWAENMKRSREVYLKYTSKHKRVANGWKKWQGEVRGLRLNNVMEKKVNYELKFQGWASTDETLPFADDLLPHMGALSVAAEDPVKADQYIREAVLAIEVIRQAKGLNNILNVLKSGLDEAQIKDSVNKLTRRWNGFYKNYDVTTDKDVFQALMPLFFEKCNAYVPELFKEQYGRYGQDYSRWANYVFSSMVTNKGKVQGLGNQSIEEASKAIVTDPAWQLYAAITNMHKTNVLPTLSNYKNKMSYLNRLYMKAQMNFDKANTNFPDANLTLRLSYGRVKGIDPDGPAGYSYQTNLDEAVQKHNPEVEEFDMPKKLRDIQEQKDYGRWNVNGTVPIAFIATNHTTGGNSGSPVLNAKGQLIGLNFDRIWEGTMSDLYFDPNLCRNISVDIRYPLFIVDKFGGAGWLIDEMELVTE